MRKLEPGSKARCILDTKAKLKHASNSSSVAEAIGGVVISIVVLEGVLGGAPRVRVGVRQGVLPAVKCPLMLRCIYSLLMGFIR